MKQHVSTILSAVALTNALAFGTVAMEKHIAKYDENTAAAINAMHAVPMLYEPGFALGHRVYYGNKNFTKEIQRNGLPGSTFYKHVYVSR